MKSDIMNTNFIARPLQMSDLFDIQTTESTYKRLVNILNEQSNAISTLMINVNEVNSTNTRSIEDMKHAMIDEQRAIKHRIDSLEEKCTQQSHLLQLQSMKIGNLEKELDRKANYEEIFETISVLKKQICSQFLKIKDETASYEFVSSLQKEHGMTQERIQVLNKMLETKVDKSSLSQLEDMQRKVSSFLPIATNLKTKCSSIDTQVVSCHEQINELSSAMSRWKQMLQSLREEVTATFESKDGMKIFQQDISSKLTSCSNKLQQISFQNSIWTAKMSEIESTLDMERSKHKSAIRSILETISNQKRYLDTIPREFALKSDVMLLKPQVTEVMSKQQHIREQMKEHTLQIKQLGEDLTSINPHVMLSTRFVEWFAKKGEAYEQNLQLLDAHLQKLLLESMPIKRTPYDGNVRF